MKHELVSQKKLRTWTLVLGGLIGFFVLGGWYPIANYSGWQDFISAEGSYGRYVGPFELLTWLLLGPLEGLMVGSIIAISLNKLQGREKPKISTSSRE